MKSAGHTVEAKGVHGLTVFHDTEEIPDVTAFPGVAVWLNGERDDDKRIRTFLFDIFCLADQMIRRGIRLEKKVSDAVFQKEIR